MVKTKEIPKIKENGEKEKLTVKMAIEILEREIQEDNIKLIKKQGALEMRVIKIQTIEVYLSYLAMEVTYTAAVAADNATFFGTNF